LPAAFFSKHKLKRIHKAVEQACWINGTATNNTGNETLYSRDPSTGCFEEELEGHGMTSLALLMPTSWRTTITGGKTIKSKETGTAHDFAVNRCLFPCLLNRN
jgi:hypothetical protein